MSNISNDIYNYINYDNDKNYLKPHLRELKSNINNALDDDTFKVLTTIWLCLSKVNARDIGELESLEDKIFTINGKVLPEMEKVRTEYKRILQKIRNMGVGPKKMKELQVLEGLISMSSEDTKEFLEYLKKEMVRFEASLGMNITFFKSGFQVCEEEMRYIDNVNYKNDKIKEK